MASGTFRVDGLQQLGENMRTLKRELALKISRATTNAGAQVIKKGAKDRISVNSSKNMTSVDTGSLLDAVVVKRASAGETAPLTSLHVVAVRRRGSLRKTKTKQAKAPHAGLVEFGTRNMPAEPYMRPAFDEGKADALNAMVNKLSDGLDKVVGGLPK